MRKRSTVADACAVRCIHPAEVAAVRGQLAGVAEIERATAVFALLADPTRARILHALSLVPRLCVCDVAASLAMSESAVSHQLRLLRINGLVARAREGRIAYYRLADEHVRHVLADALQHAGEGG